MLSEMACHALVIEDDGAIAGVLRMKLEREGHEVTVAPSQREAYYLLDDKRFDFVLLDLRLPIDAGDMSPHTDVGFDILAHIRERFAPDELPVIVMTAYEETSQTAVRSLKAGADDYITKPFNDSPVSLEQKVRDLVSGIHQGRRASAEAVAPKSRKPHTIMFFLKTTRVEVDGIVLEGCLANLVWLLGRRILKPYIDGRASDDPRMTGKVIAKAMDVQEHTVRQYVARFRRWIAAEHERRGLGPVDDQAIVRNARWKGYDLNRESCDVRWE